MTENEVNIYSIAYRDCKEVSDSIDVNEEFGKANTILFYMDEILESLKIASELQSIGTIEEFKALKEKSAAKKVKKSGVTDSNGVFHAINGINGVPYDLCPNCEINLCTDGIFGGNTKGMKYCKNCGQKLDWQ